MLSGSAAFMSALSSNNRLWKIKVQVTRNGTGQTPVDITDRVITSDIDFDFDKRNGQASLVLDNYDYSLSPVNKLSSTNQVSGGIFDPLLDSNHVLEVWEGLLVSGGSYEYIKRFTGVLGDEIDADTYPGVIQLTCRDKSKLLQDAYIYQSKTYSSMSGNAMIAERVIQDLINTFLPSGGITVNVIDPTNFAVGSIQPYTASDTNIWDAIQLLSDAFNFMVMFDENGTCNMKKVVRDLTTVTPVYTLNANNMTKDRISTNDSSVRNHVKLRVQNLNDVELKNDDSIAKYGRRYMEVHRALSNLIVDQKQATDIVLNVLKDLSYTHPIDQIEIPLMPLIQVGDVVSVVNNSLGTDASTYTYRVMSIKDSFSKDKKRTSITAQAYTAYNPTTIPSPNPPTLLSGNLISRTIQNYIGSGWAGNSKTMYYPFITWTPPIKDVSGGSLTNDFGGYTVYRKNTVSDTAFYPIASLKSYIQATNLVVNYFYDYGAISGNNQYYLVAHNRYGQVSAIGNTFSITKPSDLIT